jgi:hypothetical protein
MGDNFQFGLFFIYKKTKLKFYKIYIKKPKPVSTDDFGSVLLF